MGRSSRAAFAAWVLLAFAAWPRPVTAQAAQPALPELKLSVVVAPLYAMGAAAKAWGEGINAAGVGSNAVLYPAAVLAKRDAAEEFRALQSGAIDVAVGSALQWSDALPSLGAVALPWMAPTTHQLVAVAGDAEVRRRYAAVLDAAGVHLVAMAPLRHRVLSTQSKTVGAPGDLRGLRVRAGGPRLVIDTFVALGALPTGLRLEDARAALQAGELDGQEAAAPTLVAARAWATGARHVVQWGAFASVMLFTVNKARWEGWPPATQEAVRAAALKAIASVDSMAKEKAANDELARNGVAITRLTAAGHAAFREAAEPAWRQWLPRMDAALVDAVRAAAARGPAPASAPATSAPATSAPAIPSTPIPSAPASAPAPSPAPAPSRPPAPAS